MKLATLAGLSVGAPVRSALGADGAAKPYGGPYFILINASGGWDPTFVCDPKLDKTMNRVYTAVGKAGAISYADYAIDASLGFSAAYKSENDKVLLSNGKFFGKHKDRLLVINGVDTSTNSHLNGSRTMWSGRLAQGYPSFGALVAAAKAPEQPLAYLSSGGFDATEGIIPLTRASSLSALKKLLQPNQITPGAKTLTYYHSDATMKRILRAHRERLDGRRKRPHLRRKARAMNALYLAREGAQHLDKLALPATLVDLKSGELNGVERLMQQTQIALSAFKSGFAVSCNLNIGGFDTHAQHDRNQRRQLAQLLGGVDFVFGEIDRLGLRDKVYVMVGSDFGRTPRYNAGNGKDHWPITSVMFAGPKIKGDRVIGASDDRHRPNTVDAKTLALSTNGVRIKTGHIHQALRELAGIHTAPLAKQYPLADSALPLFSASS